MTDTATAAARAGAEAFHDQIAKVMEPNDPQVNDGPTPHDENQNIAGDPAAAEAVSTALQVEGVPPVVDLQPEPTLHPVTTLPGPLHLSSPPTDESHPPDSPTSTLITSLRAQLTLVSEQAHQLNAKLIDSISKHADLEDQVFHLQSKHTVLEEKTEGLEKDKAQWEESMSSGLLVERDQIKDEMQRLAAGLVEEERRRGSAEEKRREVEDEINDLTAKLFTEAQTLVAKEHMSRVSAEARLKETEENLLAAETAMRDMQLHLQSLPSSAAPPPTEATTGTLTIERKYLASHLPYTEFASFLSHLRSLRPLKDTSKATSPLPQIATFLSQPFLARTVIEDQDPTLRLDIAPDLSWLSRRSVLAAVTAGDLVIEPLPAEAVIASSSGPAHELCCSLCGKPVFGSVVPPSPGPSSQFGPPPVHPSANRSSSGGRFSLRPFFNASSPGTTQSPTSSPMNSPGVNAFAGSSQQSLSLGSVYIFRIAKSTTASTAATDKEQIRLYPLCKTGWCLQRLRATCELWHFVRTGIVQVVWHGDDGYILPNERDKGKGHDRQASTDSTATSTTVGGGQLEAPPIPKRKSKSGWGLGLGGSGGSGWGKAFGSRSGSPGAGSEPVTPTEEEIIIRNLDEVERQPDVEEKGLGAPLELATNGITSESSERERREAVPIIQEINPSPIVTSGTHIAEQDTLATPALGLQRVDSSISEEGSFSTPKAEDADLPEPEGVSTDGGEVILDSPKPKPPIIPQRAAARDPTTARSSEEVAPGNFEGLEGEGVAPPPLPPRHPKTPTAQVPDIESTLDSNEGEGYLVGEGWEVKTWKTVVRLKEGMWKARIGVVDSE